MRVAHKTRVAAVAAISLIVAGSSFFIGGRIEAQHELAMLSDRATAAAELLDRHLAAHLQAIEFCAASPHLTQSLDLGAFEEECGRLVDLIGSWLVVVEVGPTHRQIVNTRLRRDGVLPAPYPRQDERPTLLDIEDRSRREARAVVSDAFFGRVADRPVLTAGRMVTLADGREAMLYTGIEPQQLSRMLAALEQPSDDDHGGDSFLGVVDGAFRAIARSDDFEARAGVEAPGWFRDLAASAEDRLGGVPGPLPDDPDMNVAIRRLVIAPNWIVWAGAWRPAGALAVNGQVAGPLLLALVAGLLSTTAIWLYSRAERRRERRAAFTREAAAAEHAEQQRTLLLTTMAHQVRSPLTALLGAIELGPGSDRRELVTAAARAGEAVLQRVDDILELAHLRSGSIRLHPTPTDICETLRGIADLHGPRARSLGMSLNLDIDPSNFPILSVDRLRLEQIVDNLVDNALTHAQGGPVTINAALVERQGETARIEIAVRDAGDGVPEPMRDQIFLDFVRGDAGYGGASRSVGLGLPIARQLARSMDGDVFLVDSPQGADFRVSLRLTICDLAVATDPEGLLDDLLVILAEDEPVIREITAQRLREAGAEVIETTDGAEALTAALEHDPDVMLLDIEMPVLDGIETARRARADRRLDGVTLLALTSHVGGQKAAAARSAGMDGVMAKPLQLRPIAAAVRARRGLSGGSRRATKSQGSKTDSRSTLVDVRIFGALAALPGDRLASELLPRFETECVAKLDEIATLIRAKDGSRAAEVAHQLKGIAMTFGAAALADAIEEATPQIRAAPDDGCHTQIDSLRTILFQTASAMREHAART